MTTRLIQMDIIQLNIGSNPCTTAKHFVLFLLLYTLTIVPSISFIIFTLLSKPPLITKQVEQSGWTLTHVGCNANIQNHEMREPIAIAVQASTTLHTSSSICICITISTVYKSFSICVFTLSE